MTIHTIKNCVKFLKSNEMYSENDVYNQTVYGFRKEQLIKVNRAMQLAYGLKSMWPERLKIDYDWLYNQYIETNNDIEIIERELESCRTKQN